MAGSESRKKEEECFQAWWSFMWSLAHQRDLKRKSLTIQTRPKVPFIYVKATLFISLSCLLDLFPCISSDDLPAFPSAANIYPVAIRQYLAYSSFSLAISAWSLYSYSNFPPMCRWQTPGESAASIQLKVEVVWLLIQSRSWLQSMNLTRMIMLPETAGETDRQMETRHWDLMVALWW